MSHPSHLIVDKGRFPLPSEPRFRDWQLLTGLSRGVPHVEASLRNDRRYSGYHHACRSAERSLLANTAHQPCHGRGSSLVAWTLLGHFSCSNLFVSVPNSTP